MKIFIYLILMLGNISRREIDICHLRILNYYNLKGQLFPKQYNNLVQYLPNNYCPMIKYSCCTVDDFIEAKNAWEEQSYYIKLYLSQMFKAILKVNSLQSSLLEISNFLNTHKETQCKYVDTYYFNSPIDIKDVYFYLENGMETFAYIQKGFYCMICDAKAHPFIFKTVND